MSPARIEMPGIVLNRAKARVYRRWIESNYWYFLKDCCKTIDDRYAGAGLDPVRAFPVDEPYLQYLWFKAWKDRRVAANKFRQGMATNLYCVARKLVFVLFFEGSSSYILKRAFKEADIILKTRIMGMWESIPERVRIKHEDGTIDEIEPKELLPHPRYSASDGSIIVERKDSKGGVLPPSFIYALEGSTEKARGITGSDATIDEAAYTENLIKVYTAITPAMEYVQLISSPRPGEYQRFFYSINS